MMPWGLCRCPLWRSPVFRGHEDFAPAAEVAALAVEGVAFPNESREVVPAHTGNVA